MYTLDCGVYSHDRTMQDIVYKLVPHLQQSELLLLSPCLILCFDDVFLHSNIIALTPLREYRVV